MRLFGAGLLSSFTVRERVGAAAEAWKPLGGCALYSGLHAPVHLQEGLLESSTVEAFVSQLSTIVEQDVE